MKSLSRSKEIIHDKYAWQTAANIEFIKKNIRPPEPLSTVFEARTAVEPLFQAQRRIAKSLRIKNDFEPTIIEKRDYVLRRAMHLQNVTRELKHVFGIDGDLLSSDDLITALATTRSKDFDLRLLRDVEIELSLATMAMIDLAPVPNMDRILDPNSPMNQPLSPEEKEIFALTHRMNIGLIPRLVLNDNTPPSLVRELFDRLDQDIQQKITYSNSQINRLLEKELKQPYKYIFMKRRRFGFSNGNFIAFVSWKPENMLKNPKVIMPTAGFPETRDIAPMSQKNVLKRLYTHFSYQYDRRN